MLTWHQTNLTDAPQNFKHYQALLLFIQNKTKNSNKFCMIKRWHNNKSTENRKNIADVKQKNIKIMVLP